LVANSAALNFCARGLTLQSADSLRASAAVTPYREGPPSLSDELWGQWAAFSSTNLRFP